MKYIFTLLLCLGSSLSVFAIHRQINGGKLSYTHIADKTFQVSFQTYYDCNGSAFHDSLPYSIVAKDSVTTRMLHKVSTEQHPTGCGNYYNCFITLIDTINLNKEPYKSWIDSGACKFVFTLKTSVTFAGIVNFAIGNGNFVYGKFTASIDACTLGTAWANSSPSLSPKSLFQYVHLSEIRQTNLGINDKDKDRIVSKYTKLQTTSGEIDYYTPYSYSYPVDAYCATNSNPCLTFIRKNSVSGFNFDTLSSQIAFKSIENNKTYGFYYSIEEWRLDGNNKYIQIGHSTCYSTMNVIDYKSPNPIIISNDNHQFYMYENDTLTFDIKAIDPMTSGASKTPTLKMIKNSLSDSIIFQRSDNKSVEYQANIHSFQGDAIKSPMYIYFESSITRCIIGESQQAVKIDILSRLDTPLRSYNNNCDSLTLSASVPNKPYGELEYHWTVYDSNSNLLRSATGKKSYVQFDYNGKHIIELKVFNVLGDSLVTTDTFTTSNVVSSPLTFPSSLSLALSDSIEIDLGNNHLFTFWDYKNQQVLTLKGWEHYPNAKTYLAQVRTQGNCDFQKEVTVDVDLCLKNNKPTITSSQNPIIVNEGELVQFDIYSSDQPQNNKGFYDTTALFWKADISAATWTIQDSPAREKSGQFTWQTKHGDAGSSPYTTTFYTYDESCPELKDSIVQTIQLRPRAQANTLILQNCGLLTMEAIPFPQFAYPATYNWEVRKLSTNDLLHRSSDKESSYQISSFVTAVVKLDITNAHNSTNTYFDTLELKPFLPNEFLDETAYINNNKNLHIVPSRTFASYSWSDNSDKDTFVFDYLKYGLGTHVISAAHTGFQGCVHRDSIAVTVACSPNTLELGEDQELFLGQSLELSADKDYHRYEWSNLETTKTINIKNEDYDEGDWTFWLKATDELGCEYNDTTTITVQKVYSLNELHIRSLKAFPSPAADKLTVELEEAINGQLIIYNLIGKKVLEQRFTGKDTTIDIRSLPSSTYIIKIKTGQATYAGKFVKE